MVRGSRDFRGTASSMVTFTNSDGSTHHTQTIGSAKTLGWFQAIDPMKIAGTKFIPGKFSVNPVTITKYTSESTPGSVVIPYIPGWGSGFKWTGDLIASVMTSSCQQYAGWSDPTAAERCKIKAYANMNTPNSDLGLLLAEAKETLAMMINPLAGARGLIMKMVKGSNRRRKNPVKFLADQWLEYRYGILPAVSDIEMLKGLFNKRTSFDVTKLFRESGRETKNPLVTTEDSPSAPWYGVQVMAGKEMAYKRFTVATVYYNRTTHPRADTGAGLHDLPSLIWELVPFSFVVD